MTERWTYGEREVIPTGVQGLVVEFPGRLTDPARQALRWDPTRPLVLQEGGRIRSIGPDGRVTPDGAVQIVLPWWAIALGGALGAFATLVIGALTA